MTTADKEGQTTPKTFNPHKSLHFKTVIIQGSPSDSSSDLDNDANS